MVVLVPPILVLICPFLPLPPSSATDVSPLMIGGRHYDVGGKMQLRVDSEPFVTGVDCFMVVSTSRRLVMKLAGKFKIGLLSRWLRWKLLLPLVTSITFQSQV